MATETTLPNLTQDARLYKYVHVPAGGWKYLRADYDEHFLKPHSVFLPKSNHPVYVDGGYYVANDEGKWHRLHEEPVEAWRMFKLCRVQGQMRWLKEKINWWTRSDGCELNLATKIAGALVACPGHSYETLAREFSVSTGFIYRLARDLRHPPRSRCRQGRGQQWLTATKK